MYPLFYLIKSEVSLCVSPCSLPRTYKVRTMKPGLKITRSVRTLNNNNNNRTCSLPLAGCYGS